MEFFLFSITENHYQPIKLHMQSEGRRDFNRRFFSGKKYDLSDIFPAKMGSFPIPSFVFWHNKIGVKRMYELTL